MTVREAIARPLYSALLRLVAPAYLGKLWWRGREEPLYRHALAERFGFHAGPATEGWVWVHAVSLGETRAAAALVAALRAARPDIRVLLTHGTATGREAGAGLLRGGPAEGPTEPATRLARGLEAADGPGSATGRAGAGDFGDRQAWLPFDTPGAVRRFFRHFRPAVGVLMETEVWPNLLAAAEQAGVPMVLANARLSEKSLQRAERLPALMRPAAQRFARVLAQTESDARRLRAVGAPSVEVCGNLKFDMQPDAGQLARGRRWRAALGRPVVLAASTREGEEAMLLTAWRGQPGPRPLLLVVPRHPQRFNEVAGLAEQAGFSLVRRSTWDAGEPDAAAAAAEIWLGDTMGEMALYYGLADVALLGGSYAPLGGQNLIEAAACGCPVVAGPHTYNFAEAAEGAVESGAAVRVDDIAAGVVAALGLVRPQARAAASVRALAFADEHRGAAARMAVRILELVPAGHGNDRAGQGPIAQRGQG